MEKKMIRKFVIGVIATLALTNAAFAQYSPADTNFDGCVDKDETKALFMTQPEDQVSIVNETDDAIQFTSPLKSTDLIVLFDGKGCAVGMTEVGK